MRTCWCFGRRFQPRHSYPSLATLWVRLDDHENSLRDLRRESSDGNPLSTDQVGYHVRGAVARNGCGPNVTCSELSWSPCRFLFRAHGSIRKDFKWVWQPRQDVERAIGSKFGLRGQPRRPPRNQKKGTGCMSTPRWCCVVWGFMWVGGII